MTETLSVQAAGTQLPELVKRAAGGEEIILAQDGKPVAKLVPADRPSPSPRKPGAWRGRVHINDDFDAPLPTDVLEGFQGRGK